MSAPHIREQALGLVSRDFALGWYAPKGQVSPSVRALHDITQGVSRWYLWTYLGWQDIRQRYRRSRLGPFWLTASMGLMVGTLGFVYGALFNQDTSTYLPYLASGFIFWGFISTSIGESSTCFVIAESTIKQVPMPLTVHVLRTIARNFVILLHNMVIWLVVLVLFPVPINFNFFLVIPGIILVSTILAGIGLLLATICTRFRDVTQIVSNIVQLAFFITPIMWKPGYIPRGSLFLVSLNPFHHMLSVVRDPLLGETPGFESYGYLLAMTCVVLMVAVPVFLRYRRSVPYWL